MAQGVGGFWTYVLENPSGRFYIGSTDDLERRVAEHNGRSLFDTARSYSSKNGPWALVWSERHSSRAAAMARERFIKSMKSAQWIRVHLLNR